MEKCLVLDGLLSKYWHSTLYPIVGWVDGFLLNMFNKYLDIISTEGNDTPNTDIAASYLDCELWNLEELQIRLYDKCDNPQILNGFSIHVQQYPTWGEKSLAQGKSELRWFLRWKIFIAIILNSIISQLIPL